MASHRASETINKPPEAKRVPPDELLKWTLVTLPNEMVLEIYYHLDLSDVSSIGTANKHLRSIVQGHRAAKQCLHVFNVDMIVPDTGITAGIIFNSKGHLIFTDFGRHSICSFDMDTRTLKKLIPCGDQPEEENEEDLKPQTGDCPLEKAKVKSPHSLALDKHDNIIFSDAYNHVVRRINVTLNIVETLAGQSGLFGYTNGSKAKATFYYPFGIVYNDDGTILVCDDWNHCVRIVEPCGDVKTLVGSPAHMQYKDGPIKEAHMVYPGYICKNDKTGELYIASEHGIRVIKKNIVSTIWAHASNVQTNYLRISGIAIDRYGDLYFSLAESKSDDRTTEIHKSEGIYKIFLSMEKRHVVKLRLNVVLDNIFALKYYKGSIYFKGTTRANEQNIYKMQCL